VKTTTRNLLLTIGLVVLAVASGAWAASLGEPAHNHSGPSDAVVIGGILAALIIAFLLGTGIRGPWGALLNLNRILAWPMALGYVWVHYAYHMQHGQEGGLAALAVVPRVFFVSSFEWIVFHAGVAAKTYGAPWKLRPKTVHDWYVAASWLVLVVTIPVFSVPALGAMPVMMILAWIVFAPHLTFNVYYLLKRTPARWMNSGVGLWVCTAIYLVAIANAAVASFPQ
jgi:hypothetical protein